MPNVRIVPVLLLCAALAACKSETEEQAIQNRERAEMSAQVAKIQEESKELYGKKDPFGTPEDLAPTLKYGNFRWGEVKTITPDSAKALIVMAFEKRILPARVALRTSDKEKEKQAFEVLYRRTKESLKVLQCDTSKGGTQALCITSLDKWDPASQTFVNRKSLQAFSRGSVEGSWRPVAINLKESKGN